MSTLHKKLIPPLSTLFLAALPGCFFPTDRDPVSIPVYRDAAVERMLPVTLYYDIAQIQSQNGGQPVGLVVYSVGYSACTPSAESIATMLAERGYVVAVPHHADLLATCLTVPGAWVGAAGPEEAPQLFSPDPREPAGDGGKAFFSEEQLEEFFYYRNADLYATVEYFTSTDDFKFGSLIDKPVFLVGYSLGGWNALKVAGAESQLSELHRDVTAVICQNTFVGELSEEQMQGITCPVFYLAGSEDELNPRIRSLFHWRPTNSRMVEITGVNHYIFATDLCGSPILAAMNPSTCGERTIDIAKRANELTVEFISVLTATKEVPMIEDLKSYSPDVFTIVR